MTNRRANKIIIKFSTFIFIVTLALANVCSQGCLSCDPQRNICNLCDAISGFIKAGNSCLRKFKDNCLLISSDGQCRICKPGFDLSSGNCMITKTVSANSCNIYQSTKSCSPVLAGSFYHDMIYQAVYVVIESCVEYFERNVCKRCQDGLVLNHDRKACTTPGLTDTNCGAYTSFECLECTKGNLLDLNGYTKAWKLSSGNFTTSEFFTSFLVRNSTGIQTSGFLCMPQSLPGCEMYKSYDQCSECKNGFFLDTQGLCQKNPLPSVENCFRYNFMLECEECKQGFYLLNPLSCVPVTPLPNCQIYDPSSPTPKCLICQTAFFRSSSDVENSLCMARTISLAIPNCQTRTVNKDTCAQCDNSYALSGDSTFCYKVPEHCQSHLTPTSMTETVKCLKCENGHVATSESCMKGFIEECIEYEGNICKLCNFGFMLSEEKCVLVSDKILLQNCIASDPSNGAVCTACQPIAELFKIKSPCIPLDIPVPHCIEYTPLNVCNNCETEYELNSQFLCVKKDPTVLCYAENNQGSCTECRAGYYATPLGLCAPYLELFYYNCDETEELPNGIINCLTCSTNSTPVIIDGLVTVCESPYENNEATTPMPMLDCTTYNTDGSCRECREGYVLMQSDGTCQLASVCTFGIILERIDIVSGTYSVTGKRVCPISNSVANCKYYATNFERDDTGGRPDYVCVTCTDNYYSQYPLAVGQAHTYDQITSSSDFLVRRPAVTACVLKSTAEQTNYISKGDLSNCEVVLTDQSMNYNTFTGYFGCYQCKFGYTGPPTILDAKYFIPICSEITQCNVSVRYSGLSSLPRQLMPLAGDFPHLPFDGFMTCHKCLTHSYIPVFAATEGPYTVKTNKNLIKDDLVGFRFSYNPPSASEDNAENSMLQTQCLSILDISSMASGAFPLNCGAAMVLANKVKLLYLSAGTSILCIACAPGYKATQINSALYPSLSFAIETCTKIDKCKTSTRFNGCSQCEVGFSLLFDSVTQRPRVDSCVATGSDCLYGTGSDGKCAICQDGYFLHANGQCYVSDLKNCNIFNVKSIYNYKVTGMSFPRQMDFLLAQTGFSLGSGCLKCDSSYQAVQRFFISQKICMKNPIMTNQVTLETGNASSSFSQTGFVTNCQNYFFSADVKCRRCLEGFVLTLDGRSCFPASQALLECVLAINFHQCHTCNSGFYLDDNLTCKMGRISNCSNYSNSSTCATCLYGHVLYNNACFLIPEINCELLDLSQMSATRTMTCQKCKSFYFNFASPSSSGWSLNICLPFDRPIENCSTMVRTTDGKLQCQLCNKEYYSREDKKLCLARKKIDHCERFHPTDDYCQRCFDGFFLTPNFSQCLPNPTGILFCEHYTSQTECKQCHSTTFLSAGKCLKRPDEAFVNECLAYAKEIDQPVLCVKCQADRYLTKNTCEVIQQKNCQTYKSATECATCINSAELRLDDRGFASCVIVTIPGCVVHGNNGRKVICIFCENDYYLASDIECRQNKIIVSGCSFYDYFEGKCKRCGPGKVLSSDQKRCQDPLVYGQIFPRNCTFMRFLENPICQECKPGYYFDSLGNCAKCRTDNNCLYCDNFAPEKCLVCLPGSYQLPDLSCARLLETPVIQSPSGSNSTVAEGSSFKRLESILVAIIIFMRL